MLPVIDHEPGHAAVDADVFAGDEACLVGAEEQRHFGDVLRLAHPAHGLLGGVGAGDVAAGGVDPAGRNAVHPGFACQAHSHGMGQGGDPAFGGGVALGLGLAHAVPGGCNVDHRRAGSEMGHQQLGQIERRGDAHRQGVGEFLPGAVSMPFISGSALLIR